MYTSFDLSPLRTSLSHDSSMEASEHMENPQTVSTHENHLQEHSVFPQCDNGQTRSPTIFVVFGAQGDLTKRKLIPALYNLAVSQHLPQEFAILGVDVVPMNTEDFREKISRDLQELSSRPIDATIREWLLDRLHYLPGDFRDPCTYERLQAVLTQLNDAYRTQGNYLYYLATSPIFFSEIVQKLGAQGLVSVEKNIFAESLLRSPLAMIYLRPD